MIELSLKVLPFRHILQYHQTHQKIHISTLFNLAFDKAIILHIVVLAIYLLKEKTMLVEETEYKGRPTITIRFDENDRYPFSFGMGKAKKILGALEEIKAFVEKHDSPRPQEQQTQAPAPVESEEQTGTEVQQEQQEQTGSQGQPEENKESTEE